MLMAPESILDVSTPSPSIRPTGARIVNRGCCPGDRNGHRIGDAGVGLVYDGDSEWIRSGFGIPYSFLLPD